jgi:tRNA(His) guanylyltransferase
MNYCRRLAGAGHTIGPPETKREREDDMDLAIGDRMKEQEMAEAGRRFVPSLPVCARLDGKGFSKFTKDMPRPYEPRLSVLMQEVTVRLVAETGACMGYTQSDEISLAFFSQRAESQIFFDGRIQKMTSVLASMCTAWFNELFQARFEERQLAFFDCRVWQPPSLVEAANVFLWRELDAIKNSVSMVAQHHFPHKALQGKHGGEMRAMLLQEGVDWDDFPDFFKRGTYVQRRKTTRRFTAEELLALPPRHEALSNPNLQVERSEVRTIDMPPFASVSNRVDVIFEGAEPAAAPR